MDRKSKTGEVVSYLLATVAGPLLLPVIAPVIVCTNACGYADEDSWMPGIQSGDGFVSVLTAFAYVVVFDTLIDGIAFIASGGGTVLDYPSLGVGGDGSVAGSTLEPTSISTEVPTLPPVEEENKETDLKSKTQ